MLEPWLRTFVHSELDAVMAWKSELDRFPEVKRDPEERFNDDGSNFRNHCISAPNKAHNVQLLEVW